MEWTDDAIVIATRPHGETSAVVTALTREHGRHAGLVRGGAGKAARGSIQPGNRLQLTWKARLTEQLGNFTWELQSTDGTRWLSDAGRLAAISSACALIEATLPERESHPTAFDALASLLAALQGVDWAGDYVRWELDLLTELGYGLDLSRCAATGTNDDLAYVSPRSGRAVSLSAGEAYRDRLLRMPRFLGSDEIADRGELVVGLALTGHFLERWVFAAIGKALPPARARLVAALKA
ncbi:MAG TPA: DNA repair protein RecO [Caulobacterales bacterium]|jgi:DNA repair protein RecO (recombination protein O)|nr:DNA repair protein RecO [Caulobacterales bacterium]